MSTSDTRARPPENPWSLVQRLNAGRISRAAFCDAYGTTVEEMPRFALEMLV